MNYIVIKLDCGHGVLEVPTGLVIKTFSTKKAAVALQNSANNGFGFEGLTPTFFAERISFE